MAPEPVTPADGLGVVHLFYKGSPDVDRRSVLDALGKARAEGDQVVTVAVLGHKADLAIMALGEDWWRLRELQRGLGAGGLELVDSYVSVTEVSEYGSGLPEEMKRARLYPELPPAEMPAWCFYPMSKRRNVDQNWYRLPYDERDELMREHGMSGRAFKGRVVQLITASTGIDDHEWGVTLFCRRPDDLKAVVYTMRYDEASAVYAEFGPFYAGMVAEPEVVLARTLP